jgi:hypothetical protein
MEGLPVDMVEEDVGSLHPPLVCFTISPLYRSFRATAAPSSHPLFLKQEAETCMSPDCDPVDVLDRFRVNSWNIIISKDWRMLG